MDTLLSVLEKDFAGKTTLSDCLRSGRTLPVVEVRKALSEEKFSSLDKTFFHSTNSLVMLALTGLKNAAENPQGASIEYFPTVAKACHWIQFLCEYRVHNDGGEENQSPQDSNQSDSSFSQSIAVNMVKQILSCLGGVMGHLLEHATPHKDGDDAEDLMNTDTTQKFSAQQITAFAFVYIFRLNYYLDDQPFLLNSIWKCLDEIAKSLKPFPGSLWAMAFKGLSDRLIEGVMALATSDLQIDSNNISSQIAMQCKVLKYVLGKLNFYCQIPGTAAYLFRRHRLSRLIPYLAVLLGTCIIRNARAGGNQENNEYPKMFKKANAHLSLLLSLATNAAEYNTLTEIMHASVLSSKDELASAEGSENISCHSLAALSTGSLLIQQRLLTATTCEKVDNASEEKLTISLKICETIIFTTLPGIFGGSGETTVESSRDRVKEALTVLVRTFIHLGSAAFSPTANATSFSQNFHFLLASWLHRVGRHDCHPISREILLTTLCRYAGQAPGSEDLLAFFVHLIFDIRTDITLLESLVDLTIRFSKIDSTRDAIARLILQRLKSVRESSKTSRKRKRSHAGTCTSRVLSRILPILVVSRVFAFRTDGSIDISPYDDTPEDKLVHEVQSFSSLDGGSSRIPQGLVVGFLHSLQQYCSSWNKWCSPGVFQCVIRMIEMYSSADPSFRTNAVELLRAVENSVQPNMTPLQCESMLQVFHVFLRNESWPVRRHALPAFVRFATKAPQTHKSALRDCLPKSLLSSFQSEVKQARLHADLKGIELRHLQSLPNPPGTTQTSLFPTRNTLQIVEGCYIVQMPTVDGRSAMVVFPPDPSSLSDIQYMMSSDETNDERIVHKIRRIVALDGGCKLSLTRHEWSD